MYKEPSDLLQVSDQHLQYIFVLPGLYLLADTLCSCKYKRFPAPYISTDLLENELLQKNFVDTILQL